MTRDDIIRMAKEAALPLFFDDDGIIDPLWRFAALVAAAERDRIADEAKHIIKRAEARGAAAEREACAVIAFNAKTYIEAANAIRARGQG